MLLCINMYLSVGLMFSFYIRHIIVIYPIEMYLYLMRDNSVDDHEEFEKFFMSYIQKIRNGSFWSIPFYILITLFWIVPMIHDIVDCVRGKDKR